MKVAQRALLKAESFSRSSVSDSSEEAAAEAESPPKEAEEEERVATEGRRAD